MQAQGFFTQLVQALSANSGGGCGSVAVTRVQIRTGSAIRPIMSGTSERRPFVVFYNSSSTTNNRVTLTAVLTPSDATNRDVTWTSTRILASANPSTLPSISPNTTSNPVTIVPQVSAVPGGRFIRRYTATASNGMSDSQIVIGVQQFPAPRPRFRALRAVEVFAGPYSNQPTLFPRIATLSTGTVVEVLGRYNATTADTVWYYVSWGNNNSGFVRLHRAGDFTPQRPTIRPRSAWTSVPHGQPARTRNPQRIIFHHVAGHRITCNNMVEGPGNTRDQQYHYLILSCGTIYEMVPVTHQARGSFVSGHDFGNDVTVSLMGHFHPQDAFHNSPSCCVHAGSRSDTLNQAQMAAMQQLALYYSRRYNMSVNNPSSTTRPRRFSPVAMHNDVSNQDCPGANVRPWITNTLRPRINGFINSRS